MGQETALFSLISSKKLEQVFGEEGFKGLYSIKNTCMKLGIWFGLKAKIRKEMCKTDGKAGS